MQMFRTGMLLCFALVAFPRDAAAPKFDPRLSVHTLLREDIFAGFMANDAGRLARGERNLHALEAERPEKKAELVAWSGTVALTRAVYALDAHKQDAFDAAYRQAVARFEEARRLGPASLGVKAVTAGSYLALADRLPEPLRAEAWRQGYRAYQEMFQMQSATADALPLHMKGELLAGVAQTADRTGHAGEAAQFARRILDTMPGTPYAAAVQRWKDKPELRGRMTLGCQTCHEPGRLTARTAELAAK